MPTALVIGASRGIGREFVRQLLADGWKVWATARDDASLAQLQQAGAHALKLDVARTESIATLGWQLDGEALDLALFVAGAYGPDHGAESAPAQAAFDQLMHANVLGAMQLIPAVAPMVKAGGKCMFISSRMGSISEVSASNGWLYRVSKAALNMAVKAASCHYRHASFAVLHPGWVKTDMGGPNAMITPEKASPAC
jgi:NAD(P)-dependent dehydrogenase (short-subunit alcohol dehydrogenase family)